MLCAFVLVGGCVGGNGSTGPTPAKTAARYSVTGYCTDEVDPGFRRWRVAVGPDVNTDPASGVDVFVRNGKDAHESDAFKSLHPAAGATVSMDALLEPTETVSVDVITFPTESSTPTTSSAVLTQSSASLCQ